MDLDGEKLKATRKLNGSDKDVRSMEEDIKIAEETIKGNEDCIEMISKFNSNNKEDDEDIEHYKREIRGITNIINSYKKEKSRADKLEKEYSKMLTKIDEYEVNYIPVSLVEEKIVELDEELEIMKVDAMEEDIKDIELFIDFCRAPYNFEHKTDEKSYKELSDKIEHLIKAYKELEENNSLLIQQNITYKRNIYDLKHNNIPVSLVEEKIEELNKEEKELQDSITEEEREEYSDASISYGLMLIENQREVLQELLEKRK